MAIRQVREIGDEILTKTVQRSSEDDAAHENTDRRYAGDDV